MQTIGRWCLRVVSIGFGLAIEMHEVYGTRQAQWALVFLGLWFIGVPPALWFDGIWRLARIAQTLDSAMPQQGQASESPRERHESNRRRR